MSTRQILEAFDRWRAARVPLVLVTVVETEGSTYTKAGHRILMTGAGEFQGLVSGGCLEGDLAEHARAVLASGKAELVTYDLRGEQDELWGLGIGCNGVFRVLLQPLSPDDDYAAFQRHRRRRQRQGRTGRCNRREQRGSGGCRRRDGHGERRHHGGHGGSRERGGND